MEEKNNLMQHTWPGGMWLLTGTIHPTFNFKLRGFGIPRYRQFIGPTNWDNIDPLSYQTPLRSGSSRSYCVSSVANFRT
jgi:hypothetical protein